MALPDWVKDWDKKAAGDVAEYTQWPYEVKSMTQAEIEQAVKDSFWQTFRLGLKGMSTGKKLACLDAYRYNRLAFNSGHPDDPESRNPADKGVLERDHEVQIDNYINALKRGGLLNDRLEVIR